jgi:low affinity Fe/Cu permease
MLDPKDCKTGQGSKKACECLATMKKPKNSLPRSRSHRGKFQRFARTAARVTGSSKAFVVAIGLILVWGITGPLFHFSDTWQLVINTTTTIITFLMVFLIQNTQNRDSEAMQIKLDELLRATSGCHNAVMDIENLSETELDSIKQNYARLAEKAIKDLRKGKKDIGAPELKPKAGDPAERAAT